MADIRKPKVGDVVPDLHENKEFIKKKGTKHALSAAYKSYLDKAPGSRDKLLTLVRKFFYDKLYQIESGRFKNLGTSNTVDDWTQEALFTVWRHLEEGKEIEDFYAYLNARAHFDKVEAAKYMMGQRREKVPLEVEIGEDSYTGESDIDADSDNPAIYDERAYFGLQSDFTFPRSLLDGLEEIDHVVRAACDLIISGRTMKQIAAEYNMTEKALNLRFLRVRRKMGIGGAKEKGPLL